MSYVPAGHLPDGHLPDGHLPEASESTFTPVPRLRFVARRRNGIDSLFTFAPVIKDPAEQLLVELDFYAWCVTEWKPNEWHEVGDLIRPTRGNGYPYGCTTAGTTGFREPSYWPRAQDATLSGDGSVVWQRRPASATEGLSAISDPSAISDITVNDIAVDESTKILATYANGGNDGVDYEVAFTFTLAGVIRVARQLVLVRHS